VGDAAIAEAVEGGGVEGAHAHEGDQQASSLDTDLVHHCSQRDRDARHRRAREDALRERANQLLRRGLDDPLKLGDR
jgi:hypothetical protein